MNVCFFRKNQSIDTRNKFYFDIHFASGLLIGAFSGLFSFSNFIAARYAWTISLCGVLLCAIAPRYRFFASILVGLGWILLHVQWGLDRQLPVEYEKQTVWLHGTVAGLPVESGEKTRFRFQVDDDPVNPDSLRSTSIQVVWYDSSDIAPSDSMQRKSLAPGQSWRLKLQLRKPRGTRNPGGFDAERFALAHRIVATGVVHDTAAAERLASERRAPIDMLRSKLAIRIRDTASSTSARFIQALAIGDTRDLSDRDWEILRVTGLTHLMAISGFHVGVVAGLCAFLARGVGWLLPRFSLICPRPQAMVLGAFSGAFGYAALAGFSLPTVRALLMIGVISLCRLFQRRGRGIQSLLLALIVIVIGDPLQLLLPGFWLSFAGVAWLVWCLPDRSVSRAKGFLSAQCVVTIGLWPLTIAAFGQASLIAPLANLLAIPWWSLTVIPLTLIGTGLDLVVGDDVGVWRLAGMCFDLSWKMCEGFAAFPFALYWPAESRPFAIGAALIGAFWLLLPRSVPGKFFVPLLWMPLLFPDKELPQAAGAFEVTVIDVGQGLAVLVRTAGHVLLYDTGPMSSRGFDAGARIVNPTLRAMGVTRIDSIVVSHMDLDHAGGLKAVQRFYAVDRVHTPAPQFSYLTCVKGTGWTWDDVHFHFMHPGVDFPYLGNESSCVLKIESAYGSVLLPGDIGRVIESRLLREQRERLASDIVVAPHHGSRGSSSLPFTTAVDPKLVLISAGYMNRFGHPHESAVRNWQRNGAELVNTAESGAVRVWVDAEGISLREERIYRSRLWDAARQR